MGVQISVEVLQLNSSHNIPMWKLFY
jgi:hypothetical protein